MTLRTATAISVLLLPWGLAGADPAPASGASEPRSASNHTSQTITITRSGSQASSRGCKSVEWMERVSEEDNKASLAPTPSVLPPRPTLEDVRRVAPALERYSQGRLLGDLWKRPDRP